MLDLTAARMNYNLSIQRSYKKTGGQRDQAFMDVYHKMALTASQLQVMC